MINILRYPGKGLESGVGDLSRIHTASLCTFNSFFVCRPVFSTSYLLLQREMATYTLVFHSFLLVIGPDWTIVLVPVWFSGRETMIALIWVSSSISHSQGTGEILQVCFNIKFSQLLTYVSQKLGMIHKMGNHHSFSLLTVLFLNSG